VVAIDCAARPTARGGAGVIDQHRLGDQSLDPNDSELPIVHALWCFGLMVFRSDCVRATSPEGHGPLTDTPPRVSIPDSFQVCASPIFRRSRCNPTRVRFSAVSSARLPSRPRDGVFFHGTNFTPGRRRTTRHFMHTFLLRRSPRRSRLPQFDRGPRYSVLVNQLASRNSMPMQDGLGQARIVLGMHITSSFRPRWRAAAAACAASDRILCT